MGHEAIKLLGALAALALTAGCESPTTLDGMSGTGSKTPGGNASAGSAEAFFESNVRSILVADCSSCHEGELAADGPDFLGASTSEYYATLTADPSLVTVPGSSLLLLKGEHTGPAFSPTDADTVAEWLDMEVEEGGAGSGGGGTTTVSSGEAAMIEFGNCMTLEDWVDTGMYRIGQQGTQSGPCMSCHQMGTGGTTLTGFDENNDPLEDDDVIAGFQANREMWDILKLAVWTVDDNGEFEDIVPAYRWLDKGDEPGQHPGFQLQPEHEDALNEWFDLTYARWSTGSCGN